jgi:membrane-associated phospholipid phosphatase
VKVHHAALAATTAATVTICTWAGQHYHEPWEHDLDWSLLSPAHTVGVHHPVWVGFWAGVSHELFVMRFLATVAIGVALVWGRFGTAITLAACGPFSYLASSFAKSLVNRPRPGTHLQVVPGSSFPSGHAFETMAGVLALAVLLLAWDSQRRRLILCLSLGVIALVGCARVALNVHYPSDVLAGWSLGFLYFGAVYLLTRPLDRQAEHG